MGDIGTVQARYEVLGETQLIEQVEPVLDDRPADTLADAGRLPTASEADR